MVMVPGELPTGQVEAATPPPKPAWVPLAKRACIREIDQILLSVLNTGRKEVHAAIERILKGWPGVTRDELWDRLRYLRNRCSQVRKGQIEWNEEHLAILQAYYAQGRAGAREAVKKLRALRPDLSARLISRQAAELGISTGSVGARPWSPRGTRRPAVGRRRKAGREDSVKVRKDREGGAPDAFRSGRERKSAHAQDLQLPGRGQAARREQV